MSQGLQDQDHVDIEGGTEVDIGDCEHVRETS